MPITDFPQQGGDKPVSLANSQWGVFDIAYAEELRREYPAIWAAGGNVLGNDQYEALSPIVRRGGDGVPRTDAEERAIRLREAWGARHRGDFRLPGVVAQIKWLVVGDRGEAYMRDVIEEAKEREERHYTRAALVESKAGPAGEKVYTFRATSEAVDRQGEVVSADGWDFRSFEANPVILDTHDYSGIDAIVGRALPPLRRMGDTWEVDVEFSQSPKGRLAKQLVDEGSLRAVSVGFRSMERVGGAREGAPLTHVKQELLEISVVPIPANPEAVRLRALAAAKSIADTEAEVAEAVIEATKAGRVLSAKNEQSLRQAVELLTAVLAGLGPEGKAASDDAAQTVGEVETAAVADVETPEAVESTEEQSTADDAIVEALRAYLAG